ncbi:MAG: ABC transporter permease, partial [Pseudomonadota bacterium]|nr:ABC transporter permease [Pseudomonadota bacterium]
LVQASAERRRQEIGLMQLRGFSFGKILGFTSIEGVVTGLFGAIFGVGLANLIATFWLRIPAPESRLIWFAPAAMLGLFASWAVVAIPAYMLIRRPVSDNLAATPKILIQNPAWKRLCLDLIFIIIAAVILWQSSLTGYRVVAAPEGVATATVDYKAYMAPGLLWVGSALLLLRACSFWLKAGVRQLAALLRPIAGNFSGLATASIAHERNRVAKGIVLVALAMSFATSTAIFNTTYQNQAAVDASLTNGADVAVTGTIDQPASQVIGAITGLSGLASLQPMQHRFAYVGTDLQDLYGIDPARIGEVTPMSNAYFENGDAVATLRQLRAVENGILVSDETVKDFQLKLGDTINLRLRNAADNAYHVVPFTFVGVVLEFPTAPRDSFLVANASYVAKQTGIPTFETLLIKSIISPHELSMQIVKTLPATTPLKISDVSEASHRIGSSLTAVDLHGLTTLELAFAFPLVTGALGLVFALGLAERRRNFAILRALGANAKQLGAFIWAEALVIYTIGVAAGLALGWLLAFVLVKLMTQVFDPPPEVLTIPVVYILALTIAGFVAMVITVLFQLRQGREALSYSIKQS